MLKSFKSLALRGAGAAALSAIASAPALAAPQSGAQQLNLDAPQAVQAPAQEIAQTYVPLIGEVGNAGYEQAKGLYLTVGVGASAPQNRKAYGFHDPGTQNYYGFSATETFGGGAAFDAGVGYDFGAIRTELTYSYNSASFNDLDVQRNNGTQFQTNNVSGRVNKNDVLASAYVDFPFGRWTPYFGGGLGYTNLSTPGFAIGSTRFGSSNVGLFGWQAKAGISYAVSYNWDVYAEGVYQGASGYETVDHSVGQFNNWGGKLGFRYRFAQPVVAVIEPAPAPAPAPYMEPAPAPAPEPAPPVRGLW